MAITDKNSHPTMSTHAWFRYYHGDDGDNSSAEDIIGAINRCGVTLERARKCPPLGAGLVLFDFVDTQVCEALEHDSRHGFDRVLAVRALGVTRIGATATKAILDECKARSG